MRGPLAAAVSRKLPGPESLRLRTNKHPAAASAGSLRTESLGAWKGGSRCGRGEHGQLEEGGGAHHLGMRTICRLHDFASTWMDLGGDNIFSSRGYSAAKAETVESPA